MIVLRAGPRQHLQGGEQKGVSVCVGGGGSCTIWPPWRGSTHANPLQERKRTLGISCSPHLQVGQQLLQLQLVQLAELGALHGHAPLGQDAALAGDVARGVDVVAWGTERAHGGFECTRFDKGRWWMGLRG